MLVSVQALRAIAALSVALSHFDQMFYILQGRSTESSFYFGASGVDLFFVISGFIMIYSTPDWSEPFVFASKRISRVVPFYWIATAVALSVGAAFFDFWHVVSSLLFIPTVSAQSPYGQIVPSLGVGWTLNYEMMFYAVLTIAMFLPRKLGMAAVFLFLIAAGLSGLLVSWTIPIIRFWFDPIIVEFAFGMAIALAYRRSVVIPGVARIALAIGAIGAIYFSQSHIGGAGLPSGYRFLLWGLPAACLFSAAVLGRQDAEGLGLISRMLGLLGNASYSIYLLHTLVLHFIVVNWQNGLNHFPIFTVLAIGYVAVIIISLISHKLIERPAQRALQLLFAGINLEALGWRTVNP